MADQTPGIQNKGMLIAALVLGVFVVLIYNWQISRVRSQSKGETVYLVCFETDMKAGQKLDAAKDLKVREFSKQIEEGLGGVVILKSPDEVSRYNSFVLNQGVQAGDYLFYSHISHEQGASPADKIALDMVAVTVPLRDPPGEILRVGGRVNLVGRFSIRGGPAKAYRIIESVKVRAIGGKALRENVLPARGYGSADEGQAMYRSITIEVKPPVSLQLLEVLNHCPGGVWVEVLNPQTPLSPRAGQIDSELVQNLSAVAPPRASAGNP